MMKPLDEETKKRIAKCLDIDDEIVCQFENAYADIVSNIPYQYLAHIIRTLETYVRETKNMPFFRITCKPVTPEGLAKGLAWGSYRKSFSFDIKYDETADEIQTRVAIAHELGHLFCVIGLDKTDKKNTEPLSSLFGIITMMHKLEMLNKKKAHHSAEEIIRDFSLLKNRKDTVFNMSND